MMILSAAVALLALLSAPVHAQNTTTMVEVDGVKIQVGKMADNEEIVRWKVLKARKNIDSLELLKTKAEEILRRDKKLPHDFERVEVSGADSIDDTSETLPDVFDKQLKLSYKNDLAQDSLWGKIKRKLSLPRDLVDALSDTKGKPTKRSEEIIGALEGKKINELFAHSWGTEAVYLGLLSGRILPPKKLFIVGIPESNEEKWLMLAKYTGIEVHVVGFKWDKARIAGNAAVKLGSGLPKDTAGLDKLWRDQCAKKDRTCANPKKFVRTKFDYNVDVSPQNAPKDEFFKMHLTKLDHDRMMYYAYLSGRKLLTKTVTELGAPQLKLIEAEERRMLIEANDEAVSLIARARAQAKIAERDHDERLKNARVDLARRFCAAPGSVSQAELDALPKPYGREIADNTPPGLQGCEAIIYSAISNGAKADALIYQIPVPIHAAPPPVQAVRSRRDLFPRTPFSSNLPDLKNLAVSACSTTGLVAVDEHLFNPGKPYGFSRDYDDRIISELSANLGDCSRPLFNKLVEMIRAGQGAAVTGRWLRDRVNDYSSRPPYAEPSRGAPRRGGRCEDYGNIRCP